MNLLKCAIAGFAADASHSCECNYCKLTAVLTLRFSNVKKLQKTSVKKPHV